MNTGPHEMIQRRLSGTMTEVEASELQAALGSDAELRRLYLDYMNLDVVLASKAESSEGTRELIVSRVNRPVSRGFQWRRLSAAASVGLLVGLFSASLVYGFVMRRQVKTQSVLTEGFEDVAVPRDQGVPHRVGVWSGDLLAPQGAERGVTPAEGLRMVALPPVEKRKFSYAFRFLDMAALPENGTAPSRRIEVTARFQGALPGVQDRFQIRLAAFSEDAEGARAIWVGGQVNEQALIHVAKTVTTAPDVSGWTTLQLSTDVPAGAKHLLISLAAGVADDEAPKTEHYLDDVQVRLINHEAPP
ncbi:hypothetical protein [Humisphaera borealis]|uniref:Uncharacterized protein n=1 Tax=Humisphaera borealis TaxID=2807512 RepID=A0A7M2WSQ8_9BACT|nr:hypothetical protein [Humisphaera borealis]QOV87630.1 hypothetical protein IPV69_15185 [Humisphaera borealis]